MLGGSSVRCKLEGRSSKRCELGGRALAVGSGSDGGQEVGFDEGAAVGDAIGTAKSGIGCATERSAGAVWTV